MTSGRLARPWVYVMDIWIHHPRWYIAYIYIWRCYLSHRVMDLPPPRPTGAKQTGQATNRRTAHASHAFSPTPARACPAPPDLCANWLILNTNACPTSVLSTNHHLVCVGLEISPVQKKVKLMSTETSPLAFMIHGGCTTRVERLLLILQGSWKIDNSS
jgi:hypothetical protein